ncbi:dihydrodipicolinate synthase family protein [Streptomyces sp. NE06-03E]|uniref:Dihydrodipicolinate synthase family protein n=2 Tax=Streptomyces TaxID=1883 RepID=A0A652LB44_9ACTN|nr:MULTISPECIES: dihydrodipicolinate synthase family protein [unclassified Streptomyces]WSS65039.1 dihydrodipicolinate synthase family protein [Streptomyces sp. NBC_01177]WSS79057.1 dihydrodipicolinate synthase family protein [Streptomyces sp. NBC_01174]MDX3058549.1 dihydrodipicolinate synthase family protein [Streptomyces sp. NE06-03E]MDX3326998.1 dihydrodipicolinate synthase family protein [Streptomyces sp. ME02-6979-3A]MDX3428041.1 dihydrodipicolinate synthase family protein [Streptomyces s
MTATTTYSGVIPPVVTPLTADGELDRASLERVVGHLLDGGVSGLFALGSSGETAYLTPAQQDEVIKVITSASAGQVPVLVGAIETTTNRAIERARAAAGLGADAVVATAPFYTRTHVTEIDRHFRDIAAAVDVPLLAYDVPVCVHSKLDPELLLPLAADGVLAGVKDSSGDDGSFRRLAIAARELPGFSVLTGHELVVDAMMLSGADGSVPGLGNVDPHGYVRLHEAAVRGDWAAARAEQDRLVGLFDIVTAAAPGTASATAAGLGAFKTALMLRGVIATNVMSPPMRRLDEGETAAIAAYLDRAGLSRA